MRAQVVDLKAVIAEQKRQAARSKSQAALQDARIESLIDHENELKDDVAAKAKRIRELELALESAGNANTLREVHVKILLEILQTEQCRRTADRLDSQLEVALRERGSSLLDKKRATNGNDQPDGSDGYN